ncbi:hypothetical protein A2U01_0114136, partial [Trifolium medium]|nr:hypothetical protein [Trifolium medium]
MVDYHLEFLTQNGSA